MHAFNTYYKKPVAAEAVTSKEKPCAADVGTRLETILKKRKSMII